MKPLFILLALMLAENSLSACHFREARPVLSLSGPVTYILKELSLLKEVKAISLFHGVPENDFTGDRLGGGIFLAPDYLKKFKNPLFFFDESQEMRKNILNLNLKGIEVKTRNLDPFMAFEVSLKAVTPWLKDCEEQVLLMKQKVTKVRLAMERKKPLSRTYVFYLGEIQGQGRKPNLVMLDNLVLYFKNKNLIKTYPTELNYASWSEKIMSELRRGQLVEIGLVNGGKAPLIQKDLSITEKNVIGQSLLIPGLAQIQIMEAFWDLLEKQDS